ncbi:ECF RNA polymerase sigma factor RpoE [Roseimaritima multifibrata]|uniref:ECF RNA polymerase sigma factor RpoE n=1 Tax=Roseimaritima multifibrata TaxID=1930274 RepID=A0A517MKL6_9BACT|nr:sigma-70 family RNA polymerase sigma factor [Roseimaritima multifibrata]QDS95432.1 ECF RNA polymerase sigma factor RpoE [Roseimaritima multifibrata]
MPLPDTRVSLLQRLHDGRDMTAWTEFCAIYERAIYVIATKYGLQDADAREVSQEVLLILSRRIQDFDPDGNAKFRSWLSTIARNATIDLLRKNRKHQTAKAHGVSPLDSAGVTDAVSDPSLQLERFSGNEESQLFDFESRREQFRWASEQVRQGVAESTWLAFWRTAVEEQAAELVAEELGLSVGAVYVARCRTLAKIKRLIEPYRENAQ